MFKKLFGQKPVPEEVGDFEPKLDKPRWVKAFQLELSNMEGSPVYNLNHELVVGSEIGDIIISDPSISPRHATFSLKEEVVSVFDHGSSTGTFVNKNPISAGRFVILEEGDLVRIGDLEIKLLISNHTVDEEDVPALPGEAPPLSEKSRISIKIPGFKAEEVQQTPPPEPVVESRPVTITTRQKRVTPKKKIKTNQVIGVSSLNGANALLRVASMIGDFLLAYAILILFLPFDEFKTFLSDIPQMVLGILNLDWMQMWSQLKKDYFGVIVMLEDLGTFLSQSFNFLPLLITFGSLRLVSTLIFGVTISQFMLGIRSTHNALWARVGGVLRVLIGFITWPFLIFDMPAVMSKRTLKEVITFTQLHVPSKALSFIGSIIYFPLLIALVLVSPIFQGLEMSQPVMISTKIDERIVADVEAPATAEATTEEGGTPPPSDITTTSQHLGLSLTYSPLEYNLFPVFKFLGEKNKLKAQGEALIIGRSAEDLPAQLSVLKSFDLRQLLGLGMHGNFMLFDRYPKIYEFVYSSPEANASFKSRMDEKSREAFAKEFIDFTKTAFELGPDNLLQTMQVRSPFIKGFVDYKSSFLELIEYKDFKEIDFARIGNAVFMRISYNKQVPFDLLIPLIPGTGKIYKLTLSKYKSSSASNIYKFALFKANWIPERTQSSGETLTPLEVIDALTIDFKTQKLSSDKAQALYGFFYEKSADVLKKNSPAEMESLKTSIESVEKMIRSIPSQPVEGSEDPIEKLRQNFQDLKSAFENKNLDFFGISTVESV